MGHRNRYLAAHDLISQMGVGGVRVIAHHPIHGADGHDDLCERPQIVYLLQSVFMA